MSVINVEHLSKEFILSKRMRRKNNRDSFHTKRISNVKAVDNISFSIEQGEIFGFLGPNGAGKTTTIRMLTGVLKPTNGDIFIFGQNFWENHIAIKQRIGNIPEMANIYMDLSGFQNLDFIGEIYGLSKQIRKQRALELLKLFDLFEKRDLKAKAYSKGMKQRLLLSMALISEPEILFLDEPISGLDVQSSRIIKELIKDYNRKGTTLFLTAHDMDVANELCDRIAIIDKGKIIGLDTPNNIRKIVQDYQALDCQFEGTPKIDELESLNAVKHVEQFNNNYHVVVENINDGICQLIDFINLNGLKIKNLSTYQPHLEDAFLKLIEGGS